MNNRTELPRTNKREEDVKKETKCEEISKKEDLVDREDVKEEERGTVEAALISGLLVRLFEVIM